MAGLLDILGGVSGGLMKVKERQEEEEKRKKEEAQQKLANMLSMISGGYEPSMQGAEGAISMPAPVGGSEFWRRKTAEIEPMTAYERAKETRLGKEHGIEETRKGREAELKAGKTAAKEAKETRIKEIEEEFYETEDDLKSKLTSLVNSDLDREESITAIKDFNKMITEGPFTEKQKGELRNLTRRAIADLAEKGLSMYGEAPEPGGVPGAMRKVHSFFGGQPAEAGPRGF